MIFKYHTEDLAVGAVKGVHNGTQCIKLRLKSQANCSVYPTASRLSRLSLRSSIKILRLHFLLLLSNSIPLFWMVFSTVVNGQSHGSIITIPTSLNMLSTKLTAFLIFFLGCAVHTSQVKFKLNHHPTTKSLIPMASFSALINACPTPGDLSVVCLPNVSRTHLFLTTVIDTTLIILTTIITCLKCYNRLL